MAKQKIKVIREEMLQVANNVAEEKNINQDRENWNYSNLPLPITKYFQKAQKKGLKSFYLNLIKL